MAGSFNNSVAGDLDIRNNHGAIVLILDRVGRNLGIRNNHGVSELDGNAVTGILDCRNNRPPVTLGPDNTAGTQRSGCTPLTLSTLCGRT